MKSVKIMVRQHFDKIGVFEKKKTCRGLLLELFGDGERKAHGLLSAAFPEEEMDASEFIKRSKLSTVR